MKILNLYAGIGGNRKLWRDDHEITAVEIVPEIAEIYQKHFPKDKVIIADAHQYLLEHYKEFDFIWSSPPCPTHSRMRKSAMKFANGTNIPAVYPDMKLYEEILFLEGYFEGVWCVENVISWYEPLIKPNIVGRHYIWSNFYIPKIKTESSAVAFSFNNISINDREKRKGFDLSECVGIDKEKVLNNCVESELGKYIFNCAFKVKQENLMEE